MKVHLLLFVLLGIIVINAFFLTVYTYKLVLIDAKSRNIPKPTWWAFFASTAQNGSGLPFYLLRRRGTEQFLSGEDKKKVNRIKRKMYALFILDIVAFISAVIIL